MPSVEVVRLRLLPLLLAPLARLEAVLLLLREGLEELRLGELDLEGAGRELTEDVLRVVVDIG